MTLLDTLADPLPLDEDGLPVWRVDEGSVLVPGALAWDRLGVGYRCETWLCWSVTRWHPVVVKLPRPHQIDHPRARAALRREARALAAVRHPALPAMYEDGTDAPLTYVAMEHVDGIPLDEEREESGPIDPAAAAQLCAVLLSAVRTLHLAGLAHLDVKPENVVLREGRPVLIDLGSARALGSAQPAGHPVGTLGWSAPEMEACGPIAPSMDVFGVGKVLLDALAPEYQGPLADVGVALTSDEASGRSSAADALMLLRAAVGPDALWPGWARDGDLSPAKPEPRHPSPG
jgi:serine/threonine protein kinase